MPFSGADPLRSRSLFGSDGRFWRRDRGETVDHVFQLFAGLEVRNFFSRHFHTGSGLGVAANAGLPLARAEASESANLDLVAFAQGADDAVEDRLHDDLGLLPGHLHHAGDFFNQISLRHRILLDYEYRSIAPNPKKMQPT